MVPNLLMTPHSRVIYPLLKRPLEMWETLRAAPESHLLAEVIPPLPTDATLPTRHTDLEGHTVTNGEAAHLWADGDYHAGGFMTEGQGLTGAQVAVGKLLEVRHVRATYARGPYGYL